MWNDLGKLNESIKRVRKRERAREKCVFILNFNSKKLDGIFESLWNVLILTDAWINYMMESITLMDEWQRCGTLNISCIYTFNDCVCLVCFDFSSIFFRAWILYDGIYVCHHIRLLHLIVKQFTSHEKHSDYLFF